MVTQKQTRDLLIGPGWAIALVVLAIIGCALALSIRPNNEGHYAYDPTSPGQVLENGAGAPNSGGVR